MNRDLSRDFVLFLESNATRLFELIESGERPHVQEGYLSKRVRSIKGIVNAVKLWRSIGAREEILNNVKGLVWKTATTEWGVWICLFYRSPAGEASWYLDLLDTKFWSDSQISAEHHHKDQKTEKVPSFIAQTIEESNQRFQYTVCDLETPSTESYAVAFCYADLDYDLELDMDVIQSGREEFIRSQPWLYGTKWSLGIGGSMRPFVIIRNHNQYFMKSIPIPLRRMMVSWGKRNGVYAECLSVEQLLLKQSVAA